MRTHRWLLVLGVLAAALCVCPVARAEDPEPGESAAPGSDPEAAEPELKGKALREHKKQVRQLVKELNEVKNRESVRMRIERMGKSGTRVERDALMLFATGNKNHEFVSHAFGALSSIGDKPSVDFLCGKNALRNKSFLIAQSAAETLGKSGDPRAAPHLLDVMLDRRTKIEVVSSCSIAVAKCAPKDERVIETLLEQSHHRKDTIRSNTLEALGYLGSDEAVARLTEALFEDKLARARQQAATGLGWTYRHDVIPTLEKCLQEDNSLQVKSAASAAISEIRAGKRK